MTALREYDRLEASGLWRPTHDAQRREVIVSVGEATLTMCDLNDRALAHWSLAAIDRQDAPKDTVIYCPDGDPGETLELKATETQMIEAIERLRQAVEKARPRPGRLRLLSVAGAICVVLAVLVFWLPGALTRHTVSVVPDIKREEIGEQLVSRIERIAGKECLTRDARPVLARLARRTDVRRLVVLRTGMTDSLLLPGGIVLLNKALIEDHEDPAIAAGYIIVARAQRDLADPLAELLDHAGPIATFRLLTTGEILQETLDRYAEHIVIAPKVAPPDHLVLAGFEAASIPSTPYAYAHDITGETVLPLIEADPMTGANPPAVLRDRDWVLLQNICGG